MGSAMMVLATCHEAEVELPRELVNWNLELISLTAMGMP